MMERLQTFVSSISVLSAVLATGVRRMAEAGAAVAGVALLAVMLLVVGAVCGRFFFHYSIRGAFEITEFLLVLVTILAVAYTQVSREHISIQFVVGRWSTRKQAALDVVYSLVGMAFFSLIIKQGAEQALIDLQTGHISHLLHIPVFLFKFMIPVGGSLMVLVLLVDFFRYFQQVARGK